MKNNITISICLLIGLVALATFLNFSDRPVEAAYPGIEMPSGLQNQTLHYSNGWQASSVLENDGVNLIASGSLTADSFINSSELEEREDVESIDDPLSLVNNLNAVSFTSKSSGQKEIALEAPDLDSFDIDITSKAPDGQTVLKYNSVVALLVEAIKEQQDQIDYLNSELRAIKK